MKVDELNEKELKARTPIEASWHNDFSKSSYLHIRNLPPRMTEGDLVILFSQYGTPLHVRIARDSSTGESLGHAFLKYEDQRSTILAVDNFNGIRILGKAIRVDHHNYRPGRDDEEVPLHVLYNDESLR